MAFVQFKSRAPAMSKRIDKSWVVFASLENDGHDRCVDVFHRPDLTFGFEEFRRDVEDAGAWTPLGYFPGAAYASSPAAYAAAEAGVPWLAAILSRRPGLRRDPPKA